MTHNETRQIPSSSRAFNAMKADALRRLEGRDPAEIAQRAGAAFRTAR